MSRATKILAGAAAVALGVIGSAKAATLTITPVVVNYWASDANIGVLPSEPIPQNNAAAGAYRVNFLVSSTMNAADSAAGFTGLGNLAFDVNGVGGAAGKVQDAFGGWVGINPSVRTAGDGARYTDPIDGSVHTAGSALAAGRVSTFTDDSDIGASTTDLKFVYVDVGQLTPFSASDPRVTATSPSQNSFLTQAAGNPLLVGSIVVHYDGTNPPGVASPVSVSYGTGEGYSLHNNTTTAHGPVTIAGATGGTVFFGTVPEPTSLAFLALGGLMAARRRRA